MNLRDKAWLDQEDAQVTTLVRKFGWAVQYVGGDACGAPGCDCPKEGVPAFAYTIGLFGFGHPELLILGAPHQTAMGVLNNLGDRVKAGETLVPGQLITFTQWPHRIIPEHVPNPHEIVFGANRFYRKSDADSVPVLQLSYDDTEGRFPWEPGHEAARVATEAGRVPGLRRAVRPGASAGVHDAVTVGVLHRLGPIAHAGLREQPVDVRLHGRLAQVERRRDLPIRQAGRDQRQHLGFARGQAVGKARCGPALDGVPSTR